MSPKSLCSIPAAAMLLVISLCCAACIPVRTTSLEGGANRGQIRRADTKAELGQRIGIADAATTDGRFVLYSLRKEAEWTLSSIYGDRRITSSEVGTTHVLIEFDTANRTVGTHFHHCDDDSLEPLCYDGANEILFRLIGELHGLPEETRQRSAEPVHAALARAVHRAATRGDVDAIEELLSQGASINSDVDGIAPVHRAALAGQTEAVAYFVGNGIPIEARTARASETAMHLAAGEGHLETVEWLLAHGAEIDAPDWMETTPLRSAVLARHVDVALHLINAGAEVSAGPGDVLILAAQGGDAGLVESLLEHGADVNSKGGFVNGRPALYFAVQNGSIEIASLLLAHGARFNTGPDAADPLHTAVEQRDIAMVRLLLENGADPHKRIRVPGRGAITPAEHARLRGENEIAELLDEFGDSG